MLRLNQNANRVKNQRFLPVLNISSTNFLDSFCAATFLVASSKTSGVTTPFKSTSNEYRVGMRWFKLMYSMKVLHLDRLSWLIWCVTHQVDCHHFAGSQEAPLPGEAHLPKQ